MGSQVHNSCSTSWSTIASFWDLTFMEQCLINMEAEDNVAPLIISSTEHTDEHA